MIFREERNHVLSFLTTCSKISLSDFLLAKQNRAANLEKQLHDLSRELCENLVYVELAHLLRGRKVVSIETGRGPAELSSSPTLTPPQYWRWIGRRTDLKCHEVFVLVAIKSFCPKDSNIARVKCWQLMGWTKLSRRAVMRALQGLRKKKFIETEYTGRGDRFRVLEPPPELLAGVPIGHTSSALQAHQLGLIGTPEPPGVPIGHTLSVKSTERWSGMPVSGNGDLGEIGVRGLTHIELEIKKLQLQAEILRRTAENQKLGLATAESNVGKLPAAGPIRVNPEALQRAKQRQEQELAQHRERLSKKTKGARA